MHRAFNLNAAGEIPTDNIGWKVLLVNMNRGCYFEDRKNEIVCLNRHIFEQTGLTKRVLYARVPMHMLTQMYEANRSYFDDLYSGRRRLLNLEDFIDSNF